jgi:hypothetical protein
VMARAQNSSWPTCNLFGSETCWIIYQGHVGFRKGWGEGDGTWTLEKASRESSAHQLKEICPKLCRDGLWASFFVASYFSTAWPSSSEGDNLYVLWWEGVTDPLAH